jgi:hypothetical protein
LKTKSHVHYMRTSQMTHSASIINTDQLNAVRGSLRYSRKNLAEYINKMRGKCRVFSTETDGTYSNHEDLKC